MHELAQVTAVTEGEDMVLVQAGVIDILIPVLGRPHRAAPLAENIYAVTTIPHRIIFISSNGDTAQIEACAELASNSIRDEGSPIQQYVMEYTAGQGDYARKINAAFHATDSEWVFMGADDLTFEPRWDHHAIRAAGTKHHVVGTNDLANSQVKRGQFGTHCLIRRRYITEQGGTADSGTGTVLHEGYDHNFVDRELCHVAQSRGCFVFARHSRVRHQHPLWRTAPQDDTYRKALRNFRADQKLFLSRAHLWGYQGLSDPERKLAA